MTNKQIQRLSQQDIEMAEVNRLAQRWVAAQQAREKREAAERAAIVKRIDEAVARQMHLHRAVNKAVNESFRRIQTAEYVNEALRKRGW